MPTTDHDWTEPAAMAIPEEGYFELERGRYGPIYPRAPAKSLRWSRWWRHAETCG
jgi:hypothetical protein